MDSNKKIKAMSITWDQFSQLEPKPEPSSNIVHFEGLTFFLPEDEKELNEYMKKYYP
jgi:hypothetical protein